jgi:CDP-6-deoxy-D-xylo-4-hexulose-3-dehydrase
MKFRFPRFDDSIKLSTSTWGIQEKISASKVIFSGQLTMGKNVHQLEREFAEFIGSKFALMVNSGSSANLLAAAALRLRYTDEEFAFRNEVIVPTVSWSTTYFPWHQLGFKLKFVDVSLDNFNLDIPKVIEAIDDKTVGICVVHLLGAPADVLQLREITSQNGLFLFEDACEAMGTKLQDRRVGSFGDIGSFSTYFSHHISTGEGGFVVTDDEKTAHQLISLRAHGWLRDLPYMNLVSKKSGDPWLDRFRFYLPGYNLRPMEVQAAPGIIQLRKLEKFNSMRSVNAEHYRGLLESVTWLKLQESIPGSTWFAFGHVIDINSGIQRKNVIAQFEKKGIESRPIVTGSFPKNPVINKLNCVNPSQYFPNADAIESQGFMLGNHPFDMRKRLDNLVKFLVKLNES